MKAMNHSKYRIFSCFYSLKTYRKNFILIFSILLSFGLSAQNISGIINTYYHAIAVNFCSNSVTVSNCAGLAIGDTVLVIQMKGATIDLSNTITSGSILSYNNAGNYDIAIIDSMHGCELIFRDSLVKTYDTTGLQVIDIPHYTNVTVTDTLKCLPWDGSIGGVLIFEASGTVTLNAPINVSDRGFKGGAKLYCNGTCSNTQPDYVRASVTPIPKGEGIASIPDNLAGGRGTVANGGGSAGGRFGSGGINFPSLKFRRYI